MLDRRVRALAAVPALVLALGACADRSAATSATGLASAPDDPPPGPGVCSHDAQCHRTGCSGEVCSDRDLLTSCLWRPEYACYAEPFARCVCGAGACGWAPDPALAACLAHAREH
jgi:eight-cysteine-cluster-containing protein